VDLADQRAFDAVPFISQYELDEFELVVRIRLDLGLPRQRYGAGLQDLTRLR
jgi:hypothetical protein